MTSNFLRPFVFSPLRNQNMRVGDSREWNAAIAVLLSDEDHSTKENKRGSVNSLDGSSLSYSYPRKAFSSGGGSSWAAFVKRCSGRQALEWALG